MRGRKRREVNEKLAAREEDRLEADESALGGNCDARSVAAVML